MKKIILLTAAIVLLFASCDQPTGDSDYSDYESYETTAESDIPSKWRLVGTVTQLFVVGQDVTGLTYADAKYRYGLEDRNGNSLMYGINWYPKMEPGLPSYGIVISESQNYKVVRWCMDFYHGGSYSGYIHQGTYVYR